MDKDFLFKFAPSNNNYSFKSGGNTIKTAKGKMKKELKSQRAKNSIAKLIYGKISNALSIYETYPCQVAEIKGDNFTKIIVSSKNDNHCNILTSSVTTDVIEVLNPFMEKYSDISYHFDAMTYHNLDFDMWVAYPVMVVCVDVNYKYVK